MKAKITFDLSKISEQQEFKLATKAPDLGMALWTIQFNLKREVEHLIDNAPVKMSAHDAVDEVFEKIEDILWEHDIQIDQLIE